MPARISRGLNLGVGLGDLAILIDYVRDPARVNVCRRVSGAVGQTDLALGVAQQREGKVELLSEGPVLGLVVEAGPEDLDVFGLVFIDEVPEPGTLTRSTGCVGLGIEPEHDALSAQVGQAHTVAVVIHHIEIWSILPGLKHRWPPTEDQLQNAAQ